MQLFYAQGKFEEAKKEVDKLMANPKAMDKPETYLWKLEVFSEIYADSNLFAKYPDAGKDALDAFNKYRAKDTSLKVIKERSMRALGLLYGSSFNYGRESFKKSEWEKSYQYFKISEEMGAFINENNLGSNKITIDTTTVLYTGYAAQNASHPAEASKYYRKLADLKTGGEDFEDIYKFILDYTTKQKDNVSFQKYLAIAKELYPKNNSLWNQMEMENMSENSGIGDMIAKYKEEDAAGKMDEDKYLTYAEAFASPEKSQGGSMDSAKQVEVKLLAADAYAKAFNLNKTNGIYAFNTGVLNYAIFSTLDERFYELRGGDAGLKAQRDEIEKQQQQYASVAIEWLEKGYEILKAKTDRSRSESLSLNRSVDYLANMFAWKRDKAKGVNPKDVDAFDAKFKFYDSEHDKYK